jgi:hypothetical protein
LGDKIKASWTQSGFWGGFRFNSGACRGKYYFEVTIHSGLTTRVGLSMKTASYESGSDSNSIGWGSTGVIASSKSFISLLPQHILQCDEKHNGLDCNPLTHQPLQGNLVQLKTHTTFIPGDTIGIASDFDNNIIFLYKIKPPSQPKISNKKDQQQQSQQLIVLPTITRIGIIKEPFFKDIFISLQSRQKMVQ